MQSDKKEKAASLLKGYKEVSLFSDCLVKMIHGGGRGHYRPDRSPGCMVGAEHR